jgi:hypothetical protein
VTNQAFGYYLMPAESLFIHLLPELAGSGSRSTNIRVKEFTDRQLFVAPNKETRILSLDITL